VPRYLTQEWLDEFVALAADQPLRRGASVKIQHNVTGGPDGDVAYYWVIEEGRVVDARLGTADDTDFSMTTKWEDSARLQSGDLDARIAFMQGKIKVKGNLAKMMALLPITNSAEWKALQAKVNAVTDY